MFSKGIAFFSFSLEILFILFVVLAKLLAVKHSRCKPQFVSKDHLCRIVGLQLIRDHGTAA